MRMTTCAKNIEIPELKFQFRGNDGSSICFTALTVNTANSYLAGAIQFAAELELLTPRSKFQHSFAFTDLRYFRQFRDELSAVRKGEGNSASWGGDGFSLSVGLYQFGLREGLLVEGCCSSIRDERYFPWPLKIPIGGLTLDSG